MARDRRRIAGPAGPVSAKSTSCRPSGAAATGFACLLALISGTGCSSTDEAATPTSDGGRRLYLTCSGSCHSPEPVRKFTLEEWEKILPDMNEEAKLTADEAELVRAYVLSQFQQIIDR